MILSEQTILEFRFELEELITEREGMIALNSERIIHGFTPGYDDTDFFNVQNRMKTIRESLICLGEK